MTSPLIDENALLRRIEAIERDLRELGPSIAKSFGSTVAELQAQQAELAELVEALVTGDSAYDYESGFAATSAAWVTKASTSLTVPAGYVNGYIVVAGTASMSTTDTGISTGFGLRLVINGTTFNGTTSGNSDFQVTSRNAATVAALSPTGLSAGPLDVELQVFGGSAWTTDASNKAELSALAIFTK